MTTHEQLTTADKSGTRTDLQLTPGQTAVLIRLPVTIQSDNPVNTCVTHFDARLLELTLTGQANVTLHVEDKAPGKLRVIGTDATVNEETRDLQFKLDGLTHLRVEQ